MAISYWHLMAIFAHSEKGGGGNDFPKVHVLDWLYYRYNPSTNVLLFVAIVMENDHQKGLTIKAIVCYCTQFRLHIIDY